MSKSVKIGPDLPADLAVTRIDSDKPESQQQQSANIPPVVDGVVTERADGTFVVRTVDVLGSVVETIHGTARPKVETVAELKARVVSSYVDSLGNTVETY